ncbi:transferrin-binding protein-like solute binding protein [Yoonia sp. R2-816]|uniref:transferrin-binding protein-like solute binding protein n=1 Tax=Yoonia sp. R2-816 TaxID=3342638 RepID=UPI00372756F4
MDFLRPVVVLSGGFFCLAGCPPGPTPTPGTDIVYDSVFDLQSTASSEIRSDSLDSTARSISSSSGSLDRGSNTIRLGNLDGTINGDRTRVAFDEGGVASITQGATEYVALFIAEPQNADPFFGIFGVPTNLSEVPDSGTATYDGVGSASIQIIDGTSFYELIGSASIDVNFAQGDIDMTFSDLNGQRRDGVAAPVDVSNVAVVHVNDAALVDGQFSGGVAEFSSTEVSAALSGTEVVTTSGGFFGPNGDEIGGVLLIDDTSGAGTLLVQGSFVAD